MGLTSCQEEVENPAAKEGSVTIGLSTVATRSTADEVNMGMGTTLQQIDNVVVVPMIGDAYQNPILFGNFTPTAEAKVKKQTRTMSQAVTRFKVFGNVCDGYVTPAYSALSEAAVFTGLTFTAPTWESGAPAVDEGQPAYSKPHELYYYYDTNTTGFSASKNEWSTSEPTDWATGVKLLGDNKSVKITPVNYAVGVLAAAIQNGDVTTDFYTNEGLSEGKSKFDGSQITVSGITIAGQTQSFNADFAPSGTVNVYEPAVDEATVDATTVSNTSRSTGDIYCVVAPTDAETVTLNIEFTVAEGHYFKLANGTTATPGMKLYLPVVLDKKLASKPVAEGATEIFQADKATFLNAKVMQWGLASTTPVQTTDVTIGVVFDVEWGEGLTFNVEI